MDNLLDLLIFLFIVYLFLSPLFKKSPKQKPPQPERYPYDEKDTFREQTEVGEKSEQEILKEIERLFGYSHDEEKEKLEPVTKEEITTTFEAKTLEFKTVEKEPIEVATRIITQKEITHKEFEIEAYNYEESANNYEIDEFDYTKIDEYQFSELEEAAEKIEPTKTFSIQLENVDDFKRAFIYREIFEYPLALRMLGNKWRRSIY